MKQFAFGIDLGTTFSSICLYSNDKTDIIADKLSQRYIPSVVYYNKKDMKPIVGSYAVKYQQNDPDLTIYDTKRMLGHRYDDPNIQYMKKKWPFSIRRTKNNHILTYLERFNKVIPPYQISGEILKELVSMGNTRFPEEQRTNKVVITIPANFGELQRAETLKAANYAGLNVLQIINEPTAASIAYGLHKTVTNQSYALIFDFGGGTLDISLLSIDKNTLKIVGTDGDMFLGGRDFDEKLYEYLVKKLNINEEKIDKINRIKLLENAVEVKISLSNYDETEVITSFGECEITLQEFEDVNKELIDRILIPVERLLNDTKISKEKVDNIILVGGSSHMKFVSRKLKSFFGKSPYNGIDPIDAVVSGAGIVAAKIINDQKLPKMISDLKIIDICPFSIGVSIYDGSLDILIHKGTGIPTKGEEASYTTIFYRQESVDIDIYEGDNYNIINNQLLGNFTLNLPISEKFIRFIISVSLDINCSLKVEARTMDSDISAGTEINITKIKEKNHVAKELDKNEILIINIIRFIELNRARFEKVFSIEEVNNMLGEANKLKNQGLISQSKIQKIVSKFDCYFKKFNINVNDHMFPEFLHNYF